MFTRGCFVSEQNRIGFAIKPEAVPKAEEWMRNASESDKRIIERVLKMAGRKHEVEASLRKALLPDAKETVEKWIKGANDNGKDKFEVKHVITLQPCINFSITKLYL